MSLNAFPTPNILCEVYGAITSSPVINWVHAATLAKHLWEGGEVKRICTRAEWDPYLCWYFKILWVSQWQKAAVSCHSYLWQRKFLPGSDAPEPSWTLHPRPSVTSLLLHQVSTDLLLCYHLACFKGISANETSQIYLILHKETK